MRQLDEAERQHTSRERPKPTGRGGCGARSQEHDARQEREDGEHAGRQLLGQPAEGGTRRAACDRR